MWRQFSSHSPADFLDFLAEGALRHAFQRVILTPDEDDEIGLLVQQYAIANWQKTGVLRKRLQYCAKGVIPTWVYTMGFVIAFHHCLWQAA